MKYEIVVDPYSDVNVFVEADRYDYDTMGQIEFVKDGKKVATVPTGKYVIREIQ